MAPAICQAQHLRFLKFHYLVIKAITLPSFWYMKPNHGWSYSRIINVYVLKISLDKTCWDKLKIQYIQEVTQFFKFQILPLTRQYQCWDWPIFVVKSLKLCQQRWFGGDRGFFHWKIDFLFSLNSFVQDCRSMEQVRYNKSKMV